MIAIPVDTQQRRADGEAFLTRAAMQGKPVASIRLALMIGYMRDPEGTKLSVERMPSFKTTPKTALDRVIDGSDKDVKPTAAELEVARRMGLNPADLAKRRQQRMADDAAVALSPADQEIYRRMGIDGERIMKLRAGTLTRDTTAPNDGLARQVAEPISKPTSEEREVARRLNLDPGKLAQVREKREIKDRQEVLERWDGYLNPGGPADRSYELTDLDREACGKLGVDPQAFLAWKRDPISAVRPKGLPYDPNDAVRTG